MRCPEPVDKPVAILCPGPSLSVVIGRVADAVRDYYGAILGVNRVAEAYPCDWWVFNDHEVFGWWLPCNEPRIFTCNESYERIAANRDPQIIARRDRAKWTFYPQIETTCPSDPGWTGFSMLIAMVLAEWLIDGRGHGIDIYGCDWEGTEDWDGTPPPRWSRSPYRWNNEIHKFGFVEAWLRTKGIAVRRMRSLCEVAA